MEESRSEVIFVTEHVMMPLAAAIAPTAKADAQLDEIEIQKGLIQVCDVFQSRLTDRRPVRLSSSTKRAKSIRTSRHTPS